MSVLIKKWRFDPGLQMVVDDSGAIVCSVTWDLEPAVGHLIAAAPALAAIANDLHANLSASLCAWQGEEDSVQDEHSDLIVDLDAADRRADAVLTGAGAAALPAHTLRELALGLLVRAQQIDGVVPYVVTHSNPDEDTHHIVWAARDPTERQMIRAAVGYEPGDSLGFHRVAIEDLSAGLSPARGRHDDDDDDDDEDEGEDQGYSPTSM